MPPTASKPVWLILCAPGDEVARWSWDGVRRLAPCPVELVTSDDVESAEYFRHVLCEKATLEVRLRDGRRLRTGSILAVLNRLPSASNYWLHRVDSADAQYAFLEFEAIYRSWLFCLPARVLNRPGNGGLCGPYFHPTEWRVAAVRAGLQVVPFQQQSDDLATWPSADSDSHDVNIVMLEGRFFGPQLTRMMKRQCVRLARDLRCDVLGLRFEQDRSGALLFKDATPCPDLSIGGPALIDTLAAALSGIQP